MQLLELIPRYYRHVQQNPGTLLVHFYGVHRISPALGRHTLTVIGCADLDAYAALLQALLVIGQSGRDVTRARTITTSQALRRSC